MWTLVKGGKRVAGREARIGADQGLRSETCGDLTDCSHLARAEQDFSRQPQYGKLVHIGGHIDILWLTALQLASLGVVILYNIVYDMLIQSRSYLFGIARGQT